MNELLERLCEEVEKENPDFDRTNSKDLDTLTKSYILSSGDENLRKRYLDFVIAQSEEKHLKEKIEQFGEKSPEYELKVLTLEKEILEKRIEIARKFLN